MESPNYDKHSRNSGHRRPDSPRHSERSSDGYARDRDRYYTNSGFSGNFLSLPRDNRYKERPTRQYPDAPRSDTGSYKHPKEPKKAGDVFRRFTDTTSIQGIPFISAATRWYAKVLWSLLFMGATAVWILHSVTLIRSYIKFDTSSRVKITNEALDFPTVTLCNINPVRVNTINGWGNQDLRDIIDILKPIEDYGHRPDRKKRQAESSDDEDLRDTDFNIFGEFNFSNWGSVGEFESYLEAGYSSTYLSTLLIRETLATIPDYNRTQMGHRLRDMLLGCTYDGITCKNTDFAHFLDSSYGNCFSFNSAANRNSSLISIDSGSTLGLDMVLYIQNKDYIRGLDQGRGIRLYVHDFGSQPFVEESGISISTGRQTYIGLRQIRQTRLGGKYGKCGDDGEYEDYYNGSYHYTLDACYRTCWDRQITNKCGCYRRLEKQYYNFKAFPNLRPCSSNKERQCVDNVIESTECNCRQACETTDFDFLLSNDHWPDDSLWYSLADSICVTATDGECDQVQNTPEDSQERFLEKNFIHLKIYYRDLNLEIIEEVPSYEDIQFYSDLGGAVGLWLGASIITIFELFDLLIRLVGFCCRKDVYRKRKEKLSHFESNPASQQGSKYAVQSSPAKLRRVKEEDSFGGFSDPGRNVGTPTGKH